MAIEQFTESITLSEMKCVIGENKFGYVYPQGDVADVDKIDNLLKFAGGKPKDCPIENYAPEGKGKAKPEFVITFNKDINTIIVVECKKNVSKHMSSDLSHPAAYAVDGVLYYTKFLKNEYNVIAIAVSGTKKEKLKVDAFYWPKNQEYYSELKKAKDIILEPENYLKLVNGEKLQKEYSLEDIRNTALEMHDTLREIKVSEKHKPIFIAGILIALEDKTFSEEYSKYTTFDSVMRNLEHAIENTLNNSDIKKAKIESINDAFKIIGTNEKLKAIPLGHRNSITWYIEQLEMKIKPMMNYADASLDALGVFYHEFVKYSGGDGKGLGIVLTPQHLTEFMCEVAGVNKNSKVVDICCGSGSFLVTAMTKMFKDANQEEILKIKKEGLYGVELDLELYTLAIANMIIRRDGKSNIYHGDCFKKEIRDELKNKNINIGLINPPYSQDDICELEFIENMLDILVPGGTGVAVVPMSCAIGTKFKDVRERIMKNNKLKAVFSMPDDIFYPTGTNTCVMVWEAHTPHNSSEETFFGYYKDDGFVKRKKLGRIDAYNKWDDILKEWLDLYRNRDIKAGLSSRHAVSYNDEWLCEAYMETDYSKLCVKDFEITVAEYLSYLVKNSKITLESKFKVHEEQQIKMNNWKLFDINKIFSQIYLGKAYHKIDLNITDISGDNTINYITRSALNNGNESFVLDFEEYKIEKGNAITIGAEGIKAFYQGDKFICGNKVNILRNEKINKYNALFITTVINYSIKGRYSYGRAIVLNQLQKEKFLLPEKNNEPDWEYMENFIKSLQYSDKI